MMATETEADARSGRSSVLEILTVESPYIEKLTLSSGRFKRASTVKTLRTEE